MVILLRGWGAGEQKVLGCCTEHAVWQVSYLMMIISVCNLLVVYYTVI